jgi:hypothetical protein
LSKHLPECDQHEKRGEEGSHTKSLAYEAARRRPRCALGVFQQPDELVC